MIRGKVSPPAVNQGAEDLAGSGDHLTRYPRRIWLTGHAESYIAQLADDLALGNVELSQLSPALRQFYVYASEDGYLHGHAAGVATARAEIERLTWEANLWYWCANNPRKKPGDYYRHLEAELWREASI